jgi:DNA modification methylase
VQTTLLKSSAHNIPIPDKSVHCVVTSPPYWGLRVYDGDQAVEWPEVRYHPLRYCPEIVIPGWRGGLGNEPTPDAYIGHMILCLREWGRVLRGDGTLWVNLGDSYAGSGKGGWPVEKLRENWNPKYMGRTAIPRGLKPKDLVGIPHLFAFAAQAEGWYLRNDIVWTKPNPLPENVTDRLTRSHEYVFLLTKSRRYYFDHVAIKEPLKESSIQRLTQSNFWNQTGGEKDYANGVNPNRSMRRSSPNFAASNGVPRFGGSKEYPDEMRLVSGNEWMPDIEAGANKRDVWMVEEESDPFARFCAERGVDLVALREEYEGAASGKDDTWRVATKPYTGAHFAAFPEDLVRPMILAGTSAKGVCPTCGDPWARVIEKGGVDTLTQFSAGKKTTSWRPTCTCDAGESIPATVMDPFNGSGTSGRVATKLGRSYIGIDVCEEYLESLSPGRIYDTQIEMSF